MLSARFDATTSGYHVGYDDVAQFICDYKQFFGTPPLRDIKQLQQAATADAGGF